MASAQIDDALANAAALGDLPGARQALDAGADVDAFNGRPLWLASWFGREAVVVLLLAHKANPHIQADAAFRIAAARGYPRIVELLLSRKADVHSCNDFALRNAAAGTSPAVVEILLRAKADPSALDGEPLEVAALNGRAENVRLLRAAGARPNARFLQHIRRLVDQGHLKSDVLEAMQPPPAQVTNQARLTA